MSKLPRQSSNTPRAAALKRALCLAGAAAATSLAVAGCGEVILASDFDQTCEADSDCVAVRVGEMCDCVCVTAAINKADLPDYEEAARAKACGDLCSPCAELPPVACEAQKCVVR